jgi:hypothetical protein
LMSHVINAAEWTPQTPEQAAEEAEASNSLAAAMGRYSAAVTGAPAPLYSRVEFERVWTRTTGTSAEVIDPYFASIVDVVLPQIESIVQRAEQLLAEADALTAA